MSAWPARCQMCRELITDDDHAKRHTEKHTNLDFIRWAWRNDRSQLAGLIGPKQITALLWLLFLLTICSGLLGRRT